jgi:RNA polymerase sigma factor (sigma-70 family)
MMKGVCLRYSNNEHEAEDLLQDSFIKAFDKIKTYNNEGALGGWLRKITLNTALEKYRKDKTNNQTVELNESFNSVDDEIIESLQLEDLLKKIQLLPTGFRTVFNLYAVEGFNHREIGKILNISDGTSKSQYSRARLLLRTMINEEVQFEERNLKYAK